jgi:hypothetical protein
LKNCLNKLKWCLRRKWKWQKRYCVEACRVGWLQLQERPSFPFSSIIARKQSVYGVFSRITSETLFSNTNRNEIIIKRADTEKTITEISTITCSNILLLGEGERTSTETEGRKTRSTKIVPRRKSKTSFGTSQSWS